MSHVPVLLHEIITSLNIREGMRVIDGTINGGGHAGAILERIGEKGTLVGIDWDGDLLEVAKKKFADAKNVILVHGNYADIPSILAKRNLPKADAMLVDLGFSSAQLVSSGRGFSFDTENAEPLLMTYDASRPPAYELLPKLAEREIASILREFGEERFAGRIASSIYRRERNDPIATNFELRDAVLEAVPKGYERGRIHPATRTFQAIRIYANDELENLKMLLERMPEALRPGGRLAVISFHSLEDRIVKTGFREMERRGVGRAVTKKPVTAAAAEIEGNPRSRSAKLRVFEIS